MLKQGAVRQKLGRGRVTAWTETACCRSAPQQGGPAQPHSPLLKKTRRREDPESVVRDEI